jgi:hypothetical protein
MMRRIGAHDRSALLTGPDSVASELIIVAN